MDELEPIPSDGRAVADQSRPTRTFPWPSRRWLIAAAALAAGVVVFGLTRDGSTGSAGRLREVRTFVAGATSVRFEATHQTRTDDDNSEDSEQTFRTEGTLHPPDWARVVWRDGDSEWERISTAESYYHRDAPPRGRLGDQRWVYWPHQEPWWVYAGEAATEPDFGGILREFGGPPLDAAPERRSLPQLLNALRDPERVDEDTIRASLPLRALFTRRDFSEAMLDGRGTVRVELTSSRHGRLDRLAWKLDAQRLGDDDVVDADGQVRNSGFGNRFVHQADVRFTGWNTPVSTDPPDLADVDRTPTIDEEELAAVDWVDVLAPKRVPTGWMLSGAAAFDEDGRQCPFVELDYGPPPESLGGLPGALNLRLMMTPAGCDGSAYFDAGASLRKFAAGPHQGSVHRERSNDPEAGGAGEFLLVVLVIEKTQVIAESNLPERELAAVLATLAPLDLSTQPVFESVPTAR